MILAIEALETCFCKRDWMGAENETRSCRAPHEHASFSAPLLVNSNTESFHEHYMDITTVLRATGRARHIPSYVTLHGQGLTATPPPLAPPPRSNGWGPG